jgi:hypothetical protein
MSPDSLRTVWQAVEAVGKNRMCHGPAITPRVTGDSPFGLIIFSGRKAVWRVVQTLEYP